MADNPNARIVALDVGTKRIGVASANVIARLAAPLTTVNVDDDVLEQLQRIFAEQTATALVVGLPRSMAGEDTEQTTYTRDFVKRIQTVTDLPIYWQDEAVTSRLSEDYLQAKGQPFSKAAVDAMAATYILEDYLMQQPSVAARKETAA